MMSNNKDEEVIWVITTENSVEYEDYALKINSCIQGESEVKNHREGWLMHSGGAWRLKLLSMLNNYIVERISYVDSMYFDWKWILIKLFIWAVRSSQT